MHIFHKTCVEGAISNKRSCPLCRRQIGVVFLMDNPEHEEQCKSWNGDRQGYTLKAAFQKKFNKTPEEMGLRAEEILRPESLHGQDWVPEISSADKSRYYHECIDRGYSFDEVFEAENRVLDGIRDSFAEMLAGYDRIEVSHAEMLAGYDRIDESHAEIRADFNRTREICNEIHAFHAECVKDGEKAKKSSLEHDKRIKKTRDAQNRDRIDRARYLARRVFLERCVCVAAIGVTIFVCYKFGKPVVLDFLKRKNLKPLLNT